MNLEKAKNLLGKAKERVSNEDYILNHIMAMIYVVVEELIPTAQREIGGSKTDIATIGCLLGFTLMMILDVALG